ncbi:MAG: DUF420 domain-containing protein [Verrucomicrobiota bacterium]
MTIHQLPAINASLNGLSGAFILAGWFFIKAERKLAHMVSMSCAILTSALFLGCYVTYHILKHGVVTRFAGEGMIRSAYFALLISHTMLAATVPVLVVLTVIPALRARYDQHRRIARWTLPVWLYVSVTGVLVYMMLYQWFPVGK